MKPIFTILFLTLLFFACQPGAETGGDEGESANPVKEVFERNSQTVLSYLEDWQNESVDYVTYFAEDYQSVGTGFGDTDTTRYQDLAESDNGAWTRYDFELVTDPLVLLPGVNVETKEMDGSVRYYGEWRVISPASDSTDEKSATFQIYQTYDFNEEGKIIAAQTYGDFAGITNYLNSTEE